MPTERVAGKLGRLPVKPQHERYAIPYLHDLATLPPPTYPVDVSRGITDWGIDGNGDVGDCGPCAYAHETMLGAGPFLSGQQVVDLYFRYTHNQDVGVNLADFLLWLFRQGLVKGFAPLKLSTVDAWLSASNRGAILGVSLTDDDEQAFNDGRPWSATTPNRDLGHAILKVKALKNGDGTVVTWGADQQFTSAWSNACVEEAWALVDEQDIGTAAYASLVTILNGLPSVHPAPVPTPPPPPSPSPNPSPPPPTPSPGPIPPPPAPGAASFPGESVAVAAKVHRIAVRRGMTDDAYLEWLLERLFRITTALGAIEPGLMPGDANLLIDELAEALA